MKIQIRRNPLFKNVITWLAPLVPYIAVAIGLYGFQNAWAAMLGYHAGALLWIFLLDRQYPWRRLLHSSGAAVVLFSILIGLGGGLLMYLLWPRLGVPLGIDEYVVSIGLNDVTWPVFLVYFTVVNPFIEEYYWRGCLGSERLRPVINDFWFAGYHVLVLAGKMSPVWLAMIFLLLAAAAWAWRQMNRRGGGLLPSLACHIAGDISIIGVMYYLIMYRPA